MNSVITTQNLTRRYGEVAAVSGLTLTVPEGSIYAFLGANGAGKTTTIKTLMNILTPSSGSARVLGVNSTLLGPKEFAQIGYVSENQRLPEWMTVEQLINFCRPMYPTWDPAFCTKLLEEFDLPLDRKLKHLSRGMKMKAALLTSLAYRPRLLVLDEPFSGLDPLVRDEVIRGMLELTEQENWTVLISSHDIDEVERLADWVTEHELDRTGAAQSAWKYLMALSITHPWDWEVHGLYSRLLVDAQQPGPAWQEAKLSLFLNPEPSLGDLNFFAFIGAIAAKGEWPEIQKAMKQAALDDKVAELAIVQSDKLFSANNKVSITVPKKS